MPETETPTQTTHPPLRTRAQITAYKNELTLRGTEAALNFDLEGVAEVQRLMAALHVLDIATRYVDTGVDVARAKAKADDASEKAMQKALVDGKSSEAIRMADWSAMLISQHNEFARLQHCWKQAIFNYLSGDTEKTKSSFGHFGESYWLKTHVWDTAPR